MNAAFVRVQRPSTVIDEISRLRDCLLMHKGDSMRCGLAGQNNVNH